MGKRALGVVRLSVVTDESTSVDRQRQIIEAEAKKRGSKIIGWVEDPDISASKVHPFDRPELGPWLSERYAEFDELLFWRIDRLVRKVSDLADMLKWAEKHSMELVSATEPFDTSTPLGKAMVYIIGVFAEMESANTATRMTGSHAYLRRAGRWPGGHPPFGYKAVANPGGNGKVLAVDEDAKEILREIVERVGGLGDRKPERVSVVVEDLNARKMLSPKDYVRSRWPDEPGARRSGPRGTPWQDNSVRAMLRSRALLGEVTYRPPDAGDTDPARDGRKHQRRQPRTALTGDDGMNLVRAEPLVTQDEWARLQAELDSASRVKTRWKTTSLLLGVGTCGRCGTGRLYLWKKAAKPDVSYYRCQNTTNPVPSLRCRAGMIRCDVLDEVAGRYFLQVAGNSQIQYKVFVPGEDHSAELRAAREALSHVRDEFDAGKYAYHGGQDDYDSRTGRLVARIQRLEKLPQREPGWELRETGRTFAQSWADADVAGRRKLMLDGGLRLTAGKSPNGQDLVVWFRLDPDLARRAALAVAGHASDIPLPERELWIGTRPSPGKPFTWRVPIAGEYKTGQHDEDAENEVMAAWMGEDAVPEPEYQVMPGAAGDADCTRASS